MAGPSRHGGHEAHDQMQRSSSQGGASNDPQVALPWLRLGPLSVSVDQDALPLRSLDPVSNVTTGFTASAGDQLRTPLSTGLSPLTHASQQPANLPTNRGRITGSPTPSRLIRRRARLARQRRPVYAGGQEGRERGRPAVPPHVLSERNDRRREMNGLFTLLQRVLPTPSTASSWLHMRASVLKDAIKYIEALKVELAERNDRRREMNGLFTLLQRVLPTPSTASSGLHMRASVLTDAIKYIEALKVELATERQGNAPRVHPSAAVATLPAPGSHPSTMASCIGNNVAVTSSGRVFFVTVMSRFPDTRHDLHWRVLTVLVSRRLDVDPSVSTSVRDGTVILTFNCQAHPTVNMTSYELHGAVEEVVNELINSTK